MEFAAWLGLCDTLMALEAEGLMTDDYPDYDWVGDWDWGCTPQQAVVGARAQTALDLLEH